jgi:NitT/TauT family transport system ATP-binding protein
MTKSQRLPHVSIGELFGLVEVMDRAQGPDDVFRLGQALMLGVDALLPLLEAVKLLGWASVAGGDYSLTEHGERVARVDAAQRKLLVRSSVRGLPLIAFILRSLERADHVSREAIVAPLRARLGEEEAERQVDTAVDWGRQAELFDYDADEGFFHR